MIYKINYELLLYIGTVTTVWSSDEWILTTQAYVSELQTVVNEPIYDSI